MLKYDELVYYKPDDLDEKTFIRKCLMHGEDKFRLSTEIVETNWRQTLSDSSVLQLSWANTHEYVRARELEPNFALLWLTKPEDVSRRVALLNATRRAVASGWCARLE